jgi:hypothetical protein
LGGDSLGLTSHNTEGVGLGQVLSSRVTVLFERFRLAMFWLNGSYVVLCTYLDGAGAGGVALSVGQGNGRKGGEDDGETHLECELEIIGKLDYCRFEEYGEREREKERIIEKRRAFNGLGLSRETSRLMLSQGTCGPSHPGLMAWKNGAPVPISRV